MKEKVRKNLFNEATRLIRGSNRKKHTDRPSKWNSGGAGMSKHYSAGHSPQHPRVKAQKLMEYNKLVEEEKALKVSRKPKMYQSIKELLKI